MRETQFGALWESLKSCKRFNVDNLHFGIVFNICKRKGLELWIKDLVGAPPGWGWGDSPTALRDSH